MSKEGYAVDRNQVALRKARECLLDLPRTEMLDNCDMEAAVKAYLDESGLILVPREPTEEMIRQGYGHDGSCTLPELSWKRMISAYPNPFESKQDE